MAVALQLPIGVTSRSLPDRYASLLTGGSALQNNVAGQVSYIGVYNNATDGSVLRIYAVSCYTISVQFLYFESVPGNPGTLYTADNPYGAIDPRTYTTPGQMITFTSAVCVGTHLGKIICNPTTGATYAPGWPLGITPPNYSFVIQVKVVNVALEAGIWWVPVPGPLTPRM